MRRLILPVLILAVAITAMVLTGRADEAADPGQATDVSGEPSLASPILSARRAPAWLRAPIADSLLSDSVGAVLSGAPEATCVLVERDGEPIAANNVNAAIRPGALQRLLTITALESISNDAGFRTEVAMRNDAEIDEDGVLDGDLWLIGGADPVLATSDYIDRFEDGRTYTDFGLLVTDTVSALQALGVTSIRGRIIGDETKYSAAERDYVGDEVTDPTGEVVSVWTREQLDDNAVGPLSALVLNDGFDAWPLPPEEGEEAAEEDPAEGDVEEEEEDDGSVDQSQNERSDNPAVSAAAALDDALEEAGIPVSRSATDGEAPPLNERETLAEIDSPPLDEILQRAMIDATTAEMLLKEFGVRSGLDSERGLAVYGLVVLEGFTQAGLPFTIGQTQYHDGSGRSDANRTTCEMIHAAVNDPDGPGAQVAVPVADSPLAACAPITSGELSVVATVSPTTTGVAGHFVAENGDRLTFALMVDEPDRLELPEDAPEDAVAEEPLGYCNPLQAAMLDAVAGHPYGPELADLAPLSPTGG